MLLKVAASEKGDAAGFDFEVLYIYLVATPDAALPRSASRGVGRQRINKVEL